jgi:NAD(P)-dependent dehydrogenase (short-subunit alcohol dehydrogenase family)
MKYILYVNTAQSLTGVENPRSLPVSVIVGATSKWQANGPNTVLAHGRTLRDEDVPVGARWGLGGALAKRFAAAGHLVVLTTRSSGRAAGLAAGITEQGGSCLEVELDVSSPTSVEEAFTEIRERAGDPHVVVYNAGYMAGRALPAEQELLEHFPSDLFEEALTVACRGPFLVAKRVLPAMRARAEGALFFSNNQYSLRGRKRHTGESLYYPRTMMRALAQALTEEYSSLGVHIANIVVDGFIDSPGTRTLPAFSGAEDRLISPTAIAESVFHLYTQDRSAWTHELQLTAASTPMSV